MVNIEAHVNIVNMSLKLPRPDIVSKMPKPENSLPAQSKGGKEIERVDLFFDQ